jgi:putative peptidoglycan lipid II flippase
MTKLTKSALIVAISFGINKILAIFRQLIIARLFGLSSELDVFNVANNVPDLLFALISGGALAMAIIPVLSEVLTREGRTTAWHVFSRIANLAFLITLGVSLFVAIFAGPLVSSSFGIAPGFSSSQQELVVELMRLNLIATIIFSMAGLFIGGLQANQHFLLPALAPILYNLGQIFGALILAPEKSVNVGFIHLPALNMGVYGLVYGVLIGSILFLLILIPGLFHYQFKWSASLNLNQPDVRKILVMLGPRVLSMLFYQLTFIIRDNIASHLPMGAVTALTYGWMILQVPETLIGTAIGTALLPTISEHFARRNLDEFNSTIQRTLRVLIALSVPITFLLATGLQPFLSLAFGWDDAGTQLLLWITRAFIIGLAGHCLLELGARIFFAKQNAVIPLIGSVLNLFIYLFSGNLFAQMLSTPGVALADALAFSLQALFLLAIHSWLSQKSRDAGKIYHIIQSLFGDKEINLTWIRSIAGGLAGTLIILIISNAFKLPPVIMGTFSLFGGMLASLPLIWQELRILVHL